MSDIEIKEIITRRQIRHFIKFQRQLLSKQPGFIPPLVSDEMGLLTDRNPSLEHAERRLWMAYRNGKPVGRVAGIINHSVNEVWHKKAVRFGWFDFVEDIDVCRALLDQVAQWGRSRGMDTIEGPFGFTDMDKECWIIEGFDARQNATLLFNPEYYVQFIKQLGFEPKCYWEQYEMPASQPIPAKVQRLNGLIMEKYNLRLLKFKRHRDVLPYARKFFYTLNASFKGLYDFVPLTEREIDVYIKQYFPFVNLDFAHFVVDQDDNLIAFGLSVPELNEGYRKANGHLFPIGWWYLLRCLRKFHNIDMLLNGVHPDWQKRGVHSIYYAEMNRSAIRHHVDKAYTNPQIIGNEAERIWGNQYEVTPIMKRAIFGRDLQF